MFENMLDDYRTPENQYSSNLPSEALKNDAVCIVEAALETGIDSWNGENGLENVILNYAGISADEEVTAEDQLHYDALTTQIAHVLQEKGADYDSAQKSIIAGNDNVFGMVLNDAREFHNSDNRPEWDSIGEYLESSIGTLYDSPEIDKIAEDCEFGYGFISPEDINGIDMIGEKMIKKVVGGELKMVKKKVGRKKRLSPEQKKALEKAQHKAHTGAAKRKRLKAKKVRKNAGLKN